MRYRFIGGKADKMLLAVPRGAITLNAEGDSYIAIEFKDEKSVMHRFYMLQGSVPIEAKKRYLELSK